MPPSAAERKLSGATAERMQPIFKNYLPMLAVEFV